VVYIRQQGSTAHPITGRETMRILTPTNAKTTKTIRNISSPEWGIKKFSHHSESLGNGEFASTYGEGSSSAVLFDSEYGFWEVIS
jgi:hypothetical protein